MKFNICLILLSLSVFPACFSSTGLDEDGCEPNPCTGTEVEYCESSRECEQIPWCGTTIYCSYVGPVTPPAPPTVCAEPRPMCADSIEVSVCPPGANCTPFEWCGQTLYCASEACNALPPACAPDEELSDVACTPSEIGCTELITCGESVYCRPVMDCFDPVFGPCMDATSSLWQLGEGQCPDFDDEGVYCSDALYCGAQHYCVTACAPGDNEVFHPSECLNSFDCYASNPPRDDLPPSWCEGGGGPACRAIPSCDEGEEIPLNALCDLDGYCEYRSVCSTTIQCRFGPVLG